MNKKVARVLLLSLGLMGCSQEKNQAPAQTSETISSVLSEEIPKESKQTDSTIYSEAESSQLIMAPKIYTESEKQVISQEFLDWASYRAEIGSMAVSNYLLGHGDWYANTVNGEIQIQNIGQGIPGYDHFPIHLIGGVVFYTSKEPFYGYDERPNSEAIAVGFHRLADLNMPITQYLLGDDGIVYELGGMNPDLFSFSGGYGLYADDGTKVGGDSPYVFLVSEDTDAQVKYTEILMKYD
ncbi:hypothetical protein C8U37_11135 [Trichococcus patagoniensis]|uniref:Uncharacterized protein n=1 Tax=Trichococcus patagoniensis TaxID=382641 RepID=A0A2T5IJF6_9LACT|nr:hypothetical protein [Trichococcus patagoniensis]PTQ83950.1 hypothetical protein C8U37_11135 [Trichococcus patagoniensis]